MLVAGLVSLALFSVHGQWPALSLQQTASLPYLGIGPTGSAFYLWDYGMKRCDPTKVATLSYLTPVLSTVVLCAQQGQSVTAMTFDRYDRTSPDTACGNAVRHAYEIGRSHWRNRRPPQ
ncbi:DMT family transporter [Burkholderia orbicola]|uniref:DMT family transporter n=1 Tax=Burkholderia orbicola TaxID=2978683 RepID=UPI003453C839